MSPSRSAGPRRVLVAMSGGVDSSVAAALLRDAGHHVVGVTLKLWGGESDTGCCSVSDVDDARRAADRLGIEHHVFNFGHEFTEHVVAPYVADHGAGRTPNPCIECNRHLKFDRLLQRARVLGFDAVATGHHARVVDHDGHRFVARGRDGAKDQSYVLHVLGQDQLRRVLLPIGPLTKVEVRQVAARLGLPTAAKPDSQDVCFITTVEGRARFLDRRLPLTPGRVVDLDGEPVGSVDAVELVTVGQRRGLGTDGGHAPRFALSADPATATVVVGSAGDLLVDEQPVTDLRWTAGPVDGPVLVQTSAHGTAVAASIVPTDGSGRDDADGRATVRWAEPHRRIAPGQSVVLYLDDRVVGGALAVESR